MMHSSIAEQFIAELQAGEYFQAHETLEALWFPKRFEEDHEVKLLKGCINAAVSFELIKRGRVQSSQKVWKNYLKYKAVLEYMETSKAQKYIKIIQTIETLQKQLLKTYSKEIIKK